MPPTAIQAKTHFRINCRFSLPFSCIVFKVPSHSSTWLFWSPKFPFPPALLSAQLIYHILTPFVNTFFQVFFAFFDVFWHFRTLIALFLLMFVFLSTSCGSSHFQPQSFPFPAQKPNGKIPIFFTFFGRSPLKRPFFPFPAKKRDKREERRGRCPRRIPLSPRPHSSASCDSAPLARALAYFSLMRSME